MALLIANFIAQHSLLSWSAWPVTFAELATPALLAMASTPAILGGGIDISVAPLFTLVSVVIEVMLLGHGITSAFVVIPVAVAAGAAIGAVNGVLVNYGRYQAVVATLCMNFILSGFALGYAPSPVSGTTGWLTALGSTWGGVPGGLILIAVPLLAWWGLSRTPFVKTLLAVGGSETTAYTAGRERGRRAHPRLHARRRDRRPGGRRDRRPAAPGRGRRGLRHPVHPARARRRRARRHLDDRRTRQPARRAARRGGHLPDREPARRARPVLVLVAGRLRRDTHRSIRRRSSSPRSQPDARTPTRLPSR